MGCNILGIHELHPMMKMRQIHTDDDQILEMPKMMQKNVLRSWEETDGKQIQTADEQTYFFSVLTKRADDDQVNLNTSQYCMKAKRIFFSSSQILMNTADVDQVSK